MGFKTGWLLALVPLFSFIGSLLGVPNLGDAFSEVLPHVEAVVNFLALLIGLFGAKILYKTEPVKKN